MRTINKHSAINSSNKERYRTHRISEGGFTLIEVLIAMAVLLIGIMGVMGMQYYAIAGNTSSREMRLATALTAEKIEELRLLPYAGVISDTDNPPMPLEDNIYAGQTYLRRWWVVPDCVALNLTADPNPCNAAIAAACVTDPDGTVAVATSAIRARTCWQDKSLGWHSVSMDSLRWDENVTP